ncbi:hypothetical protein AOLI_G00044050 [Acnodon oligacanthus]
MSVEAHAKALHDQYKKTHPDLMNVKDRMKKTFAWRRQEIAEGMTIENILMKCPFLRTSSGVGGIDFRGGLVLLPSIFRETVDHLITLGEADLL